jgi:hypothetical protein
LQNRNWPTGWEPEPTQGGAGPYPGAEPEMASLFSWIHAQPKLFGVLGYHSGVLCLLHSPADPTGISDGGDHSLIASVAKKGAAILEMEPIPPYRLHSAGQRDQQYYGDPFDFFCASRSIALSLSIYICSLLHLSVSVSLSLCVRHKAR